MRAAFAGIVIAAGSVLPAASQTEPIEMSMGWRDCLAVFKDYTEAYVSQGGEVLGEIDKEGNRSTAISLRKELIVVRCEKSGWSGAKFSIAVEQL